MRGFGILLASHLETVGQFTDFVLKFVVLALELSDGLIEFISGLLHFLLMMQELVERDDGFLVKRPDTAP